MGLRREMKTVSRWRECHRQCFHDPNRFHAYGDDATDQFHRAARRPDKVERLQILVVQVKLGK